MFSEGLDQFPQFFLVAPFVRYNNSAFYLDVDLNKARIGVLSIRRCQERSVD